MVTKKTWEEFRSSGLLLFINQFLHIFGWAIIVEYSEGEVVNCYPARVKFRGFSEEVSSEAYVKLSKFMQENADQLLEEAQE